MRASLRDQLELLRLCLCGHAYEHHYNVSYPSGDRGWVCMGGPIYDDCPCWDFLPRIPARYEGHEQARS